MIRKAQLSCACCRLQGRHLREKYGCNGISFLCRFEYSLLVNESWSEYLES